VKVEVSTWGVSPRTPKRRWVKVGGRDKRRRKKPQERGDFREEQSEKNETPPKSKKIKQ
jgi:hypothetical protein